MKDLLTTYKLGWKTSYYQNTYDFKTDPSEIEEEKLVVNTQPISVEQEDEECEACTI